MHELSVCQALVRQLGAVSAAHGGGSVTHVSLRLGPLSGVEPALLRHAFPLAAAGTVADGASLDIQHAVVRVRCLECGDESETPPNRLLCGRCASFRTCLVSGDELLLESVEIEDAQAEPA
jgi:hydrogenase nickel incorporation protein HypA/HybF